MQALTKNLKSKLTLLTISIFSVAFNPVMAKSDMQIMGDVQKARELSRQKEMGDHSGHKMVPFDESQKFRGVFYGYLPCKTCAGIKMTLSLKNKNNYLLVTQYAQSSNREFFDKGKYDWNEKDGIVTLNSRKGKEKQVFLIKSEGELIKLNSDGTHMKGSQSQYSLLRTDKNKARALHIH